MNMCAHMCRGQRSTLSVISQVLPTICLETGSLLSWCSPMRLGCPASEPRISFYLPSTDVLPHLAFYEGTGD